MQLESPFSERYTNPPSGRWEFLTPVCRFFRSLLFSPGGFARFGFAEPKLSARSRPKIGQIVASENFARRLVPASPVESRYPRSRSVPFRPPHAAGRAVRADDRSARRCRRAPPRHACTCPPSPGNCTQAGSPPAKETGPGSGGRSVPSRLWTIAPAAAPPANRSPPAQSLQMDFHRAFAHRRHFQRDLV